MCGIIGLYLTRAAVDSAVLTRMRDIVAHRGPDDADNFIEGPVGLGHRRLSIIDLGTGHQPMQTADGRFTIAFNGEIYNYRELRRDLESKGVAFRTQSDTEVILELHRLHGNDAVRFLNGIFAYALWDRQERVLLLARDRAGIKPLYYARTAHGIAFGSEIKSLFESGIVCKQCNDRHVPEYLLFRDVAGPETLYSGVLTLPPAHWMAIREGTSREPVPYWRPGQDVRRFEGSYADAVDALDTALNAAVRRQMMADVPLGTFCSGGIDSSLVTAIAARHAGSTINTYSVGFEEPGFDESRFARLAAKASGSDHHEIRISESRFVELLPKLIWHNDLPLHFANSVHIYAVSVLARERVKVALTGEGADELFHGYPRYYVPRITAVLDRLPGFIRAIVLALAGALPDHRLRRLASSARLSPADRLLFNSTGVGAAAAGIDTTLAENEGWWKRRRALAVNAVGMAELDFETYLVSILNRQDKMSMATSLEARVPFLDNEIIEFAAGLPVDFKQTMRHRKRVLKDVARRYLPAEIVERRKSGFGVPLALWIRRDGPFAELLARVVARRELQDAIPGVALARLVEEHRAGAADHSEFLWSAVNLALWLEIAG